MHEHLEGQLLVHGMRNECIDGWMEKKQVDECSYEWTDE